MGMRQRLGVAACLIGDPELLILDEPMNGLDPAGMADMRDMIISLVAEGRTVVLSSHLLDEVERTCDAVAIVDRGKVVRQGPITELLAGATLVLQIECSEPDRARSLIDATRIGAHIEVGSLGLGISLPTGTTARRYRRDQPRSRGRWHLGLPPAGDPGVARIVVLTGHESTGGPGMTTPAPTAANPATVRDDAPSDHRGSPIPNGAMIATRFMELRRRRGLMIALIVVNIGIPTVFLVVRLLAHAFDPKSYGPAGGYSIYTGLVAGVMYVFGFIVAATLGCTAGSVDLTEGMFRHLVVTGRSRLALYLARIPAGLAIVVPLVAIGFTIVCAVCVFAAPTRLNYDGVNVPAGLSRAGFENWAAGHPDEVVCDFVFQVGPSTPDGSEFPSVVNSVRCGNGPAPPNTGRWCRRTAARCRQGGPSSDGGTKPTQALIRAVAAQIARQNYSSYSSQFLYPSDSLMIKSGLWLELEALIGLLVGLGLASLLGQRTVTVILMIVLEVVLTPLFSRNPYSSPVESAARGGRSRHSASGTGWHFGIRWWRRRARRRQGNRLLIPESTTVAVCVIIAWLVVWTALGAWRMMTRDA